MDGRMVSEVQDMARRDADVHRDKVDDTPRPETEINESSDWDFEQDN